MIEIGGLLAIIFAAFYADPSIAAALVSPLPFDTATLPSIAFASLLAFFSFVGFEDLANVVEEAKVPHRIIPRTMVLTLLISTILYIAVAATAIGARPSTGWPSAWCSAPSPATGWRLVWQRSRARCCSSQR